jgi:hypothetical protein
MGATPIYAFPFPDDTDLVVQAPQQFENLADAVETTVNTVETNSKVASNLTSGTVPLARVPNLPASQITSGTFPAARIGTNAVTFDKINNYTQGTGANGRFVRFPDGTQICYHSITIDHTGAQSSATRLSGVWTFPAAFTGDPILQMTIPVHTAANFVGCDRLNVTSWGPSGTPGTTFTSISVFFTGGVSTTDARIDNIQVTAFGRWF